MTNQQLPEKENAHLAERVAETPLGIKPRRWTIRDDNNQHHHGKFTVTDEPLYIRLLWRADGTSQVEEIGLYRLDLKNLLAEGFVRPEPKRFRPKWVSVG
jgi:hypothetical protein